LAHWVPCCDAIKSSGRFSVVLTTARAPSEQNQLKKENEAMGIKSSGTFQKTEDKKAPEADSSETRQDAGKGAEEVEEVRLPFSHRGTLPMMAHLRRGRRASALPALS